MPRNESEANGDQAKDRDQSLKEEIMVFSTIAF